ncbi:MAG: L-ribulose-5-phosphate 3-epimerase [Clostridiales bacterium]|nr:L-ribulose-5-phosphate 3-epimerase [Clostridiales bacterium]
MRKYTLGLYEKSMPGDLTWQEKFRNAKEAGFDYVEISIDETDEKLARLDWTKEEISSIKRTMEEEGVPIYTMCLSGHRKYPLGSLDKDTRTRSLEIMEKAINFAADLGIRIIQLAGYDVYYEEGNEETEKYFRENLKKACEMAATKGVMMGFETMETPFMDTVEKAMHYVKLMDSPYLGVYPDIGNLTNASLLYKKDVNDDLMTGKGHIVASHLKETILGHYREIPFGEGHTEYIKNIEMLKELGVKMFVGEFWYIGSENWKEDLAFANKFLREKLDKVFNK